VTSPRQAETGQKSTARNGGNNSGLMSLGSAFNSDGRRQGLISSNKLEQCLICYTHVRSSWSNFSAVRKSHRRASCSAGVVCPNCRLVAVDFIRPSAQLSYTIRVRPHGPWLYVHSLSTTTTTVTTTTVRRRR